MIERIELSVSPDYVEWGVWEALRELMQNARDEHDRGQRMKVSWTPSDQIFQLSNENTVLGRHTLVLGGTSKRDDPNQRGKFGEGYKLACATLLRLGHAVQILNRTELWTPALEFSKTYGAVVLVIKITKLARHARDLKFLVSGINKKHYQYLIDNVLFMKPLASSMLINTESGVIIDHPDYANKLYVGGIFVCEMPHNCKFGYDFVDLKLDRDRRLASPWALNKRIAQTIALACVTGELDVADAFKIINEVSKGKRRWGEAEALSQNYNHPFLPKGKGHLKTFNIKISDYFHSKYGVDAIPVTNTAEKMEAAHYGKIGIIVSAAIYNIIGIIESNFDSIRKSNATLAKKWYSYDELSNEEKANLLWAYELVAEHRPMSLATFNRTKPENVMGVVRIVDFTGPYVRGSHLGKTLESSFAEILLSKKIMNNREQVIATLVHEVAHRNGNKDGSIQHREAMQSLFASIIISSKINKKSQNFN